MFKKIVLGLLLVYSVVGFFIVPAVLKPKIIESAQQELNAKLDIGHIYFNPFIFKVELSDVHLNSLENKPLVGFESFIADIELYSLATLTLHIKDIILEKPTISVVYDKNRIINLTRILKEQKQEQTQSEEKEATPPPHILIDNVEIISGEVAYTDFTKKDEFSFAFKQIGFKLQNIDTNDFNSSDAILRFYTSLDDGGFIDFKTQVIGFSPLKVEGSLDFAASKLYSQWKYMKDELNLEVADGKVFLNANYNLNMDELNATRIENLSLSLKNLRVIPKNQAKDVLNLKEFYVKNTTIKPLLQEVHIRKVGLDGLNVLAQRDTQGRVDWLDFIKVNTLEQSPATTQETNTSVSSTKNVWKVELDELALENIALQLKDKSVTPSVTTKLNRMDIYAHDITLAGMQPFTYSIDLLLNDKFHCNSIGSVKHSLLSAETLSECKDFDVTHYNPYIDQIASQALKKYNIKLQSATVDFAAKVKAETIDNTLAFKVEDANSSISNLKLLKRNTKEKLLGFNSFNVSGVKVDTLKKDITVEKTSLNSLKILTAREKDGSLNIDNLVVAKKSKKTTAKKSTKEEEKPYAIHLKHFALNRGSVAFKDKLLTPYNRSSIDKIEFDAYNIDMKKRSWLDYKLSARLNRHGILKAQGKLRHTPLKERGRLTLKNLLLKDVTPYLQEKAFVAVKDGKLSFSTKTFYDSLRTNSKTKPDLRINGSIGLKDLLINDSRDNMPLISLNKMDMDSFTFELFPNRLFIDEIKLDSFYVDAKIDENKTLNFTQLSKSTETNASKEVKEVEKNNTTKNSEPAMPIKILKVSITEGNAKFADYSIPIKFKTDIHSLNGVMYALSNNPQETAYMDIKGEVDEYGSTKLKGSVNIAKPKEYTDLDFNFQNLELSSMSGYSATFAGHEIDKGKLFLDLGYKINHSELLGSNSIIIKKIELGDEVEDENVTVLPLGFVIGLLEDSDGIIDIDMPVEGNVDDPDFKYGALVWKTLGNLIAKAVTSPFKFLGSLMGLDGDDLEYSEFEFGSSHILPAQREKLDNIVKMMLKKPKINLKITPTYDVIADAQALKRQKLIADILKRSGAQNDKAHESAMSIETLEEIYLENKSSESLEAIATKLQEQYKGDEYNRTYLKALVEECTQMQTMTSKELDALALQRFNVMKAYLVEEKNVQDNRIIQNKITQTKENSDEKLVKIGLEVEVN